MRHAPSLPDCGAPHQPHTTCQPGCSQPHAPVPQTLLNPPNTPPPPQIAPYHMTHNAEPEAVDLLLEVERLDLLEALCDDKNYGR